MFVLLTSSQYDGLSAYSDHEDAMLEAVRLAAEQRQDIFILRDFNVVTYRPTRLELMNGDVIDDIEYVDWEGDYID